MKIFFIILITLASGFANADLVTDLVDDVFAKYDECLGADYLPNDMVKFKTMLDELKTLGTQSDIEVTDVTVNGFNFLNTKTNDECQLFIDAYDGRCYYAVCN